MPVALAKSLMPAKMGIKNPLRDHNAKSSDKTITKDMSPHPSLPPLAPMPYYQYPPQYHGAFNGPYHQLGYPLPLQQAAVHYTASPKRLRQRSSSLPSEFDSCTDKLTDYIEWLIKRYPTKFEQLTACLETLKKKDIVFETVDTINDMLWESWEVSDGIRLMVKSHQHKWERKEAKKSK